MDGKRLELRILPGLEEVSRAAADEFARSAVDAIEKRGRFFVALAGGNTPRKVYTDLAADEISGSRRLPWDKIHVFLGDERAVPPDNAESNFRMSSESLLSRVPIPAANVHRVKTELGPEEAAKAYEQDLRDTFSLTSTEWPRFDLVLLGLGPDGHTASLFPGTAALKETSKLVVFNWVEKLAQNRITFTLPVLNHAGRVVFVVVGAEKAAALSEVLKPGKPNDLYPAQLVCPVSGTLIWIVDQDAARTLQEGFDLGSN